jgi:excisionase family DNA binding protein
MTDLMTTADAAERLKLSQWAVRRLLASGRLRGSRIPGRGGGEWRIDQQALDDFLAEHANTTPPETKRRRKRRT